MGPIDHGAKRQRAKSRARRHTGAAGFRVAAREGSRSGGAHIVAGVNRDSGVQEPPQQRHVPVEDARAQHVGSLGAAAAQPARHWGFITILLEIRFISWDFSCAASGHEGASGLGAWGPSGTRLLDARALASAQFSGRWCQSLRDPSNKPASLCMPRGAHSIHPAQAARRILRGLRAQATGRLTWRPWSPGA